MIAFAAGRECNNSIVLEQGLRARCGYYYQKMDESSSSSSSLQKKMKNMDAKINTAINLAVMGAGSQPRSLRQTRARQPESGQARLKRASAS
jgi:hypothetical protein